MIRVLLFFLLLSVQDALAATHFSARTVTLADHPHGAYIPSAERATVKKREKRKMHWANTGSLIATGAFIGVAFIGIADSLVLSIAAGIFLTAALVLGIIGVANSGRKKDKSGRGWGLAGVILGAMVILFELTELLF